MQFSVQMPGIYRYPPSQFPRDKKNWQELMRAADFQLIARTADELGFGAITVPEHMVMPNELVANMGAHWPDAFTMMSFLAGATTRIRVNSSVIVLPYHHPVALAKAVSTLDVMSDGRVTVTFGAGMAEAEFAALGVPFHQRGKVTDEYLEVLRLLWTADDPEFHGAWVDITGVVFEPKPV